MKYEYAIEILSEKLSQLNAIKFSYGAAYNGHHDDAIAEIESTIKHLKEIDEIASRADEASINWKPNDKLHHYRLSYYGEYVFRTAELLANAEAEIRKLLESLPKG